MRWLIYYRNMEVDTWTLGFWVLNRTWSRLMFELGSCRYSDSRQDFSTGLSVPFSKIEVPFFRSFFWTFLSKKVRKTSSFQIQKGASVPFSLNKLQKRMQKKRYLSLRGTLLKLSKNGSQKWSKKDPFQTKKKGKGHFWHFFPLKKTVLFLKKKGNFCL